MIGAAGSVGYDRAVGAAQGAVDSEVQLTKWPLVDGPVSSHQQ